MIEIVRADGFVADDVRPLVRLNVQIVAWQDGVLLDPATTSRSAAAISTVACSSRRNGTGRSTSHLPRRW